MSIQELMFEYFRKTEQVTPYLTAFKHGETTLPPMELLNVLESLRAQLAEHLETHAIVMGNKVITRMPCAADMGEVKLRSDIEVYVPKRVTWIRIGSYFWCSLLVPGYPNFRVDDEHRLEEIGVGVVYKGKHLRDVTSYLLKKYTEKE